MSDRSKQAVVIDYTNHRGERAERLIVPAGIRYGISDWHPEPQWLLEAYDLGKHNVRTFTLKDIHSWRPIGQAPEVEP